MARQPKASKGTKQPVGTLARLLAWAGRFPLAAVAGVVAAVLTAVLTGIQIWQVLFPAPAVVTAAYVESSIAALSDGGMLVADDGTRVFTPGYGGRVVFGLQSGDAADIGAVRIEVSPQVPEQVVRLIADAPPPARESASWAGARTVDTYYVQVSDTGIAVKFNNAQGVAVDCDPQNILWCGGQGRDQQLNRSDATYPIDLVVLYRGVPPVGIEFVATYTSHGAQHEVRARPLFVHN